MQMASLDMPVMLAVALLCLPLFFVGASLSRLEGGLFLVLYAAYVWYLIALTLNLGYLSDLRTGIIFVLVPLVAVYVTTLLGVDLRRRLR